MLGPLAGPARRPARGGAGREERRAPGASRARRRRHRSHRPVSTSVGRRGRHPTQHRAVEGHAVAACARRSGGHRRQSATATPSTSTRTGSTRSSSHDDAVTAARLLARRRSAWRGRPERVGPGAVRRRDPSHRPVTPSGWTPHRVAARGDPYRSSPRPTSTGAPRPRCGRRSDRRSRGRGGGVPVPRSAVAAADHRAVPGRTPGRRARRLPAGACAPRRRARSRTRSAGSVSSSSRSWSTTPRSVSTCPGRQRDSARRQETCRRCRSSSSDAACDVDAVVALVERERLVELVGPGGVGKTALRSAAREWSTADPAAPSGAWLARLEAAATQPTR